MTTGRKNISPCMKRKFPGLIKSLEHPFVFKVKEEKDGKRQEKARLCPHGIKDEMKDDFRKNSDASQFTIIRLMISLVVILDFLIGDIDVKGAYHKRGDIKRRIYARQPSDITGTRGTLWILTRMPYRISEAGRKWKKVILEWLLNEETFDRIHGVRKIF